MLASPALGVSLHGAEWHTLGWSSIGRGETVPPFRPSLGAPIWRLKLVLAGQGAMLTGLRVAFADGEVMRIGGTLFCPGIVVSREMSLGRPRRMERIEIALSPPPNRRAVVRLFGRLG